MEDRYLPCQFFSCHRLLQIQPLVSHSTSGGCLAHAVFLLLNHNTSYTQVILYKLGAKINVFFEKVAIVWRKVEKKVTFRHAISAFGQISLIFDTDFGNYLYLCPHACKVYSYCVFCVTSCYVTHEYFESSRRRLLKLSKCF